MHGRDLILERNSRLFSHHLFTYLGYWALATLQDLMCWEMGNRG